MSRKAQPRSADSDPDGGSAVPEKNFYGPGTDKGGQGRPSKLRVPAEVRAHHPQRKQDIGFADAKSRQGAMRWMHENGFWPKFRRHLQKRLGEEAAETNGDKGIVDRTDAQEEASWKDAWGRLNEELSPEAVRAVRSPAVKVAHETRTKEAIERRLAVAEAEKQVNRAAIAGHMASGAVFADKHCPPEQAVDWVAHHLAHQDVEAINAPSAAAWSMLQWVRSSATAEQSFWTVIHKALMPDKKELERRRRLDADGQDIIALAEATLKKLGDDEDSAAAVVLDPPSDPKVVEYDEEGLPMEVAFDPEMAPEPAQEIAEK